MSASNIPPMNTTRPTALVVDDEPDICELLAMTLQRMDIEASTCTSVAAAKDRLARREFQLCLTDMRLPDGDGLELVEWMQARGLRTPVAVITAHGNVESAVRALKAGAFDFISKPVDIKVLRKLVGTAMKLPGADALGTDGLRADAPVGRVRLLGNSPPMQRLAETIAKVARSQAPVHITGESGTGKELVARMIHEQGARADGPFVPVNCGAIPGELMESEFFGHRKGSFTGAVADKEGLFQSAEGGTLFMDEIADLPLPMQVKLLRVIQEKALRPVGQATEVPVDVRILSATHKDLRALVAAGQFREDLYYRINVIELRVPPLRERGDDVDLLADQILARLAAELGTPPPRLTPEARARLRAWAFPGNVRELENVLERAVALSGSEIGAEDIQLGTGGAGPVLPWPGVTGPGPGNPVEPPAPEATSPHLGDQLEAVERDTITRALVENRYNKTATARALGVTLRALRYRMKKLGID
jgi:two-component system response regulator PilR (NtrC family)